VGRADRAVSRFRQQIRDTALPEDPVLLRIYRSKNPTRAEGQMHRALTERGHTRQDGWFNGREWFLTDLATLDALAEELGLRIERCDESPDPVKGA
jgi:hypothetical protein